MTLHVVYMYVVCMSVYNYVYTHIYICNVYIYIQLYIYMLLYVCIYICIYRMCVFVYTYMDYDSEGILLRGLGIPTLQ